jgi:hypothetical protein
MVTSGIGFHALSVGEGEVEWCGGDTWQIARRYIVQSRREKKIKIGYKFLKKLALDPAC